MVNNFRGTHDYAIEKIVIVGGGAGGLELATQLGRKLGRHKKAKITLVDRNHSHLWKPPLHEVATGSLDEGVDALSYLAHARNHGFQFQLGSVVDINREGKTITLGELRNEKGELLVAERKLPYDTLVMALGSTSNDFNTHGVKRTAFSSTTRTRRVASIRKCSTCSLNTLLTSALTVK